tara:strand:+ start:797 stop:997 length:201 start_codon:yes stop_codon:yes gene_type:complete
VEVLVLLFHKVRGVETSCQMNKEQITEYEQLNKEYNRLSGSNVKHSICAKKVLLNKVESFIYAADS